ncbi:hypothetical protein [Luteolibacter sp. AS25]|uniref:hypothetical protein n=1 Tax=Luteolibacter sp. AS25 TaxID=3135776 RepID=UPI00398B4B6F
MKKTAFIILAAGEEPESLGRVVNALTGALEYKDSGQDVQIIFDGAGTQAAAAFADPDHKFNNLFEQVRHFVRGACKHCSNAFEVTEKIEKGGIPLIDEFQGHPSFRNLLGEDFDILIF